MALYPYASNSDGNLKTCDLSSLQHFEVQLSSCQCAKLSRCKRKGLKIKGSTEINKSNFPNPTKSNKQN